MFDFHYIGMCQDVELRIHKHNRGYTRSTKHFAPFVIVDILGKDTDRKDAREIEKYFKSTEGRRYIKDKYGL